MKKVTEKWNLFGVLNRHGKCKLWALPAGMILFLFCAAAVPVSGLCALAAETSALTEAEGLQTEESDISAEELLEEAGLFGEENTEEDEETEAAGETEESEEITEEKTPSLTREGGIFYGPSGKETWYNLNMSTVVDNMHCLGYEGEYWVRGDGVKMFGDYVMCAANLGKHPRGSLLETSLGTAIVCDTGAFVWSSNVAVDIAVAW